MFYGQKYFSDKNTKVIINPQVLQNSWKKKTIFSFQCMKMSVRWSPINIKLNSFIPSERYRLRGLAMNCWFSWTIKVVITLHLLSIKVLVYVYCFWDWQRWSLCLTISSVSQTCQATKIQLFIYSVRLAFTLKYFSYW